jgi:hypothetical protein
MMNGGGGHTGGNSGYNRTGGNSYPHGYGAPMNGMGCGYAYTAAAHNANQQQYHHASNQQLHGTEQLPPPTVPHGHQSPGHQNRGLGLLPLGVAPTSIFNNSGQNLANMMGISSPTLSTDNVSISPSREMINGGGVLSPMNGSAMLNSGQLHSIGSNLANHNSTNNFFPTISAGSFNMQISGPHPASNSSLDQVLGGMNQHMAGSPGAQLQPNSSTNIDHNGFFPSHMSRGNISKETLQATTPGHHNQVTSHGMFTNAGLNSTQ